MSTNADFRAYAKAHNVPLWQIADVIGVSEPTMTRKLRYELSAEEREQLLLAVDKIVSERA